MVQPGTGPLTQIDKSAPIARLLGIDLARFLAIVGMMAAHLTPPDTPRWIENVVGGFPSTLFAVLGGFGVVFASRRYLASGHNWAAFISTVVRGLIVLGIGLLLDLLPDNPIVVILVYFGTAIICAAFLLRVPSVVLGILAVVLSVAGPLLNPLIRTARDLNTMGALELDSPGNTLSSIFFTGTYPVVTWVVYIMTGMILARFILRTRTEGRLGQSAWQLLLGGVIVGGIAGIIGQVYTARVAAPRLSETFGMSIDDATQFLSGSNFGAPLSSGWNAILLVSPHSGAVMDILRTGGGSVAVIGLCLLLTQSLKKVPVLVRPFTAAGAAPLTIYVLHVAMTALMYLVFFNSIETNISAQSVPVWMNYAFFWQVGVVIVIGAILAALGRRGPLEALISAVSKGVGSLAVPKPLTAHLDGRDRAPVTSDKADQSPEGPSQQ